MSPAFEVAAPERVRQVIGKRSAICARLWWYLAAELPLLQVVVDLNRVNAHPCIVIGLRL